MLYHNYYQYVPKLHARLLNRVRHYPLIFTTNEIHIRPKKKQDLEDKVDIVD